MRRRRRRINEEATGVNPYGAYIRKNYQISPVRGVVLDYHGHDQEAWERRRELENDFINPPSYMIGNLDRTEQQIINLFKEISELKSTIVGYYDFPMITRKQRTAIKIIKKKLDDINTILTKDVLTALDELGTADQQKLHDM